MKDTLIDNLLTTTDPQTPVAVRFGMETEGGSLEWGHRQTIRILLASTPGEDWYLTPLTMDGRPLNMTFIGHNRDGAVLIDVTGTHYLQLLAFEEPEIIKEHLDTGDIETALQRREMAKEDLSPLGVIYFEAITTFEDQVPQELLQRMAEELLK